MNFNFLDALRKFKNKQEPASRKWLDFERSAYFFISLGVLFIVVAYLLNAFFVNLFLVGFLVGFLVCAAYFSVALDSLVAAGFLSVLAVSAGLSSFVFYPDTLLWMMVLNGFGATLIAVGCVAWLARTFL